MFDETAAYIAITRLQRVYGDAVSRQAWDELEALATPDGRFSFDMRVSPVIRFVGGRGLGRLGAAGVPQFDFYHYVPLNTVVEFTSPTSATGRFWCREEGHRHETGEWVEFTGLYYDDYVVHEGSWRFAGRQYQTLASRIGGEFATYPLLPRED